MLVRHLMTHGVLTLREEQDCRDVLETFRRERIRRAPVVRGEAQELVGILSERDILRVLPTSAELAECARQHGLASPDVQSAMTRQVLTVRPDMHVEDAANLMYLRRIGGLPVLEGAKIVGMLTETDVFRAFVAMWRDEATLRLTLAPPKGETRARRPDEPLRLALSLDLHVHGLHTYRAPGGTLLTALRVSGPRSEELPDLLAARGWMLFEIKRRSSEHAA